MKFDFLKNWKPKIKPEWKKRGWVSEDELREYNFSPKMVKVFKEIDEEKKTGLLTWEYSATLTLRTPKIYLEKDGEVLKSATEPELFGEPTSYLPDGQPINKYGLWNRTYENYKDFGYDEGEYESLKSDKKDLLNYLIDFRTIVESDMTTEEKLYQINNIMSQSSESHKDIHKKYVSLGPTGKKSVRIEKQFPDSFFAGLLCELDGVGGKTAELLWDAGYLSKEAVKNAPEEELLKIKGIGKSLVNKIKKNPISTKTNNFKRN